MFKRIVQHAIVVAYLAITLAALFRTLFGVYPPFLPERLVYTSYAMMAPYQAKSDLNAQLRIEGKMPNGDWIDIPLTRYIPFGRGERSYRSYMPGIRFTRPDILEESYEQFARDILRWEHHHGSTIESVRLFWDQWPLSPDGFEALRKAPDLDSHLLVIVP